MDDSRIPIYINPIGPVTVYGAYRGDTGQQRLELRGDAFSAVAGTYARLLLTGSTYGSVRSTGLWRPTLWGLIASEEGGPGGGSVLWFEANRIIYMYRRNIAGQNLAFVMLNSTTGAGLTGATVSGFRSIDGGAQAAVTGTISEKGNGQYSLAMSAADTDGNHIGYLFTATGGVPAQIAVVTTADDPTAGTAASVWAYAIESGWSALQASRIMLAALAGKVSGANTTSIAFRDVGDTKPRISATVDQYGNRTVVSYDKT